MSIISIGIISASDTPAALKALRQLSAASLSMMMKEIGTGRPILAFDTNEFPIAVDDKVGRTDRHSYIRRAVKSIEEAGCVVQLFYQPAKDDSMESVTKEQMDNLFASELTYLDQEHD